MLYMLAVKSMFKSTQLIAPDNLEVVSISVLAHRNFTICAIYITPNSKGDYIQDLHLYLNTLVSSANVTLLGDFNAPDINWNTFTSTNTNSDSLCDFVIDHNMFQQVNKPNHIHGNILDLVITSNPDLITDLVVHSQATYSSQSDHFIVTFSVCAVVQQQQCSNVSWLAYDFNKADWNNLNRFVALKNGDAYFYSPLIYHLLNLCISSHSLPVEWQTHLTVPVHKSGHKTVLILKIIAQFLYFVSSPKLWKS